MAKFLDHVEVRAEGDINCEWVMVFEDQDTKEMTVEEYYSIDQEYPRVMGTDESLSDTNPKRAEFLMRLWTRALSEKGWDGEQTSVVKWTMTPGGSAGKANAGRVAKRQAALGARKPGLMKP